MSCCGQLPNRNRIESVRVFKPENNSGCDCGSSNKGCDTPSRARKDSPLWKWEQIYGKLVTTVTVEQDQWGKTVVMVEKKPCPPESGRKYTDGCCSLRYKVVR